MPNDPKPQPMDRRALREIWRRMQRTEPELYRVFAVWVASIAEIREPELDGEVTPGEIAERLGLPVETVRSRLRAAQKWFATEI